MVAHLRISMILRRSRCRKPINSSTHFSVAGCPRGHDNKHITGNGHLTTGPRQFLMPIRFKCPHCKKPLVVKEQMAGKKAPCPACKKVLSVPAPVSAPDLEALAAAAFA